MPQITLTLDLTPETLKLLAGLIGGSTPTPTTNTPEPKAEPEQLSIPEQPITKSSPIEPPAEPEKNAPSESVSKTDVRALALKLSKAGKQDVIKAIFTKFNAEKLSDIKEADYPALMKELVSANG